MRSDLKQKEQLFKAFANRRRLALLKILRAKGPQSVTDLSEEIKLSVKSTSRHLGILRSTGLVDFEQQGLLVYYKISSDASDLSKKIISKL